MDGFPRQGAHGRIAFLHDDPRTALRVELCQPEIAAGLPPKEPPHA
jgi:hypothetical protein